MINARVTELTVYIQRDNCDTAIMEAFVADLELKLIQRTYSTEVSATLGNIKLTQSYGNLLVPAISTPSAESDHEQYLFQCKLLMVGQVSIFKYLKSISLFLPVRYNLTEVPYKI